MHDPRDPPIRYLKSPRGEGLLFSRHGDLQIEAFTDTDWTGSIDGGSLHPESPQGKGLLFSRYGHFQIEAFTDADWAGSLDGRRSTSGYCTIVTRSMEQRVVARSNEKPKCRAKS